MCFLAFTCSAFPRNSEESYVTDPEWETAFCWVHNTRILLNAAVF